MKKTLRHYLPSLRKMDSLKVSTCPKCFSLNITRGLLYLNPLSAATSSDIRCRKCGYEGIPLQTTIGKLHELSSKKVKNKARGRKRK